MASTAGDTARDIGARVEAFVRDQVIPYERDPRRDHHGAPSEELVAELRDLARAQGVMTPHILPDGRHLSRVDTVHVLIRSGLSPLEPIALTTMAPDEGNMYLLGHVAAPHLRERVLAPLVTGGACRAFFLTEPADQMLGEAGERLRYARVRLAPARLSLGMRWLGACMRAQEIATDYTCHREAFGRVLIDHEGVGFLLAQSRIELTQVRLMIDWCAGVLDEGGLGTEKSSMTRGAVSEA